jgi:uncharacterized protein YndB with AHSA1/START domain
MAIPITTPDLSARPFELVAEREMDASADVLFQAWTEHMDRWFAAPGSVLMKPEVNGVFYWETQFEGQRHPHYGRFLTLERNRRIDLTWVTSATKGFETIVSVSLEPRGTGTHIRLVHRGFPDEESKRRHEDAWPKVLAQLDEKMRVHA